YSVAKMVATLSCLYHRRVDLNMVAGGFKNDLQALNDATPHDARYDRLVEYTTIVLGLLAGRAPVTFQGRFHSVTNVTLAPALDPALAPRLTISGSSEAGVAAARALGGLSVKYPAPLAPGAAPPPPDENGYGIRVGIIARPQREEAWATARARFPEDRRGQLTHQLAMKVSDSSWHQQLSDVARTGDGSDTYWMVPFENYKTFCPYLVGTYDAVAEELGRYLATGCRFLILDVPAGAEEFGHINTAIARAAASVGRL
ncbi:MAG TPA: LLM class flavin-dependent oxidoreductase, partial [Gemmatimonadales bacterium]|nr:LLM class flavin-dependent oxidoreductase [Gemmatimonadales bacterium]